ncbi:MAG: sialidase family protein [Eubacteriales bacterium]
MSTENGDVTNGNDWRNINTGMVIPTDFYADQPYLIKASDGSWLCVVTTGAGREGEAGQYVASMKSFDMGKTWTKPVAVEKFDGREASYAVLLKGITGRIFVFYNHNTDNIRKVKADNPPFADGFCSRVDSLGHFVFKYSDDNGISWSEKRYEVMVREFEIDRQNADSGKLRYFWNVGKAFSHDNIAYIPLHKVGGFGNGFFTSTQGVLLKSINLLTETDPEKTVWETLPDGDVGIMTPPGGGKIAEEHSFSVLDDGSFYVVFRTVDGHPGEAYSRDSGETWETSKYKSYADGRLMKHPRAANFAWKCSNGKYLYWFHNHGGTWYDDRNPVWICCGEENQGENGHSIKWSQPEILLYHPDTYVRISYPDLIEDDGDLYITETQKSIARVHKIDRNFLEKLFHIFEVDHIELNGLLKEYKGNIPDVIEAPRFPLFLERDGGKADYGTKSLNNGLSIELWIETSDSCSRTILLDSRTLNREGLCVEITDDNCLGVNLNDGRTENRWYSEPGIIRRGRLQHIGIIIDAGPAIISFVVDGCFCDGGDNRQFGWGRFSRDLRHVNGAEAMKISDDESVKIKCLRFYKRALMTAEMIGNFRTGL